MAVQSMPRQFVVDEEGEASVSRLGSDVTTGGIRVQVEPRYLPEHSSPGGGVDDGGTPTGPRWVWAYRVRLSNVGESAATLTDRRWTITDADGGSHDVEGPGVVGHRPRLEPGQGFEYESFCPLPTSWGTMEGWYRFLRDPEGGQAGEQFEAAVGRFYLVAAE